MINISKSRNLWRTISLFLMVSIALVACNSGSKVQPPTPANPSTPAPSAPDTLDSQRTTWTISSNFKNEQFVDVGLGLENAREGLGTQSILTASDLSVNLTASNVVDLNKLDEAPTGEGKKRLTYTFTNNTGKMLASVMIGMNARDSRGIQSMAYHAHDLKKPTSPEPKIINLQNRSYMIANPFVTWNLGAPDEVILAKGASFTLTLEVSYTDKDFTPAFDFAAVLVDEAQANRFFDTYLRYKLGGWKYAQQNPTPSGSLGEQQPTTREPQNEFVGSQKYLCNYADYELKRDVQEIVNFRTGVAAQLWPGALLRGKPFLQSQLEPAYIAPRAPITITVDLVAGGKVSKVVENPTQGNVQQAIVELIQGKAYESSNFNFQEVTTHSSKQASLELGISAEFTAVSIEASMDASTSANETIVTALIRETLFTVSISSPSSPAAFFAFDNATAPMQALGNATWSKEIGADNIPIYVSSVDYGRAMMLTVTSKESEDKIKAAISGSYSGAATIEGSIEAQYQQLMKEAKIEITAIGGDSSLLGQVKAKGDLSLFFKTRLSSLAAAKPLAYRFADLANNAEVKVGRLTGYTVKSCTPVDETVASVDLRFTIDRIRINENCDTYGDVDVKFDVALLDGTYGSSNKTEIKFARTVIDDVDDGDQITINISNPENKRYYYTPTSGQNSLGIRIKLHDADNEHIMTWEDTEFDFRAQIGNENGVQVNTMARNSTASGSYRGYGQDSCNATVYFTIEKGDEYNAAGTKQ